MNEYEQDDTQLEAQTAAQESVWLALQHVTQAYGAPHYQQATETIKTDTGSIHGRQASEGEK